MSCFNEDILQEVLLRSLDGGPFDQNSNKIMKDDQFWIKKIEYHCGVTILDFRDCDRSRALQGAHDNYCCSHNSVSKESIFNWFLQHSKLDVLDTPELCYGIHPEYFNLSEHDITENKRLLLKYSGCLIQDINKILDNRDWSCPSIKDVLTHTSAEPFKFTIIKLSYDEKLSLNLFKILCHSLALSTLPGKTGNAELYCAIKDVKDLLNPTNRYITIFSDGLKINEVDVRGSTTKDLYEAYTTIVSLIHINKD